MPLWQWLLDAAGAVLLLILIFGLVLVGRRRLLSRHGGTFELSVREKRQAPTAAAGCSGMGRYREDSLEWFRIFSPLPGRRTGPGDATTSRSSPSVSPRAPRSSRCTPATSS